MSTLKEDYRLVTGLVIDIEDVLNESTDKKETFRKIVWHLPAGLKFNPSNDLGDKALALIKTIADKLGIDPKECFEDDGIISDREQALLDGLSQVEIETDVDEDEPSEDPVDDPTEEPTEAPVEDPIEEDEPSEEPSEEPTEAPVENPVEDPKEDDKEDEQEVYE